MSTNYTNNTNKNRNSFTLIELLVVLALVAILSVVVVMTLNPAELIKQARDSNRLSDLATINTALNLFSTDVTSGFMGTSTVVYTSLLNTVSPTTTTCSGMGLPALPTGWTYNCPTSTQSLRNTDGTGWIPVNFQRISSNSPISQLPIDPQNTTSTKYYTYVSGGSWKLQSQLESTKYQISAQTDGGVAVGKFEMGNNMSLTPFADGLIGWWKFDEVSGTGAVDSSGWGNNGTASGTAVVAGKIGNARSFNGINELVRVPYNSSFAITNEMTMCGWEKSSYVGLQAIVGIHHAHQFLGINGIYLSGYIRTSVIDTNYNMGNTSMTDGFWHLACLTYSSQDGNLRSYEDGLYRGLSYYGGTLSSLPNDTSIGARSESYNVYFNGQIDDVRIYSRALSAAEILAIYNAGK